MQIRTATNPISVSPSGPRLASYVAISVLSGGGRGRALMAGPPFPKPKTNGRLPPSLWFAIRHKILVLGLSQPHYLERLALFIDGTKLDLRWLEPDWD
jgi:hypothetical protein